MLDSNRIDEWRKIVCDRLTAEELVELLCLKTEDIFDRFFEECLELTPEDLE